ncbi:MAG: hypothetical protein FVQ81_02180 [Candidatus Glassbacteria bacterium]|nr:hypothetical protein [Candidatus Glassbacteria bacterium]
MINRYAEAEAKLEKLLQPYEDKAEERTEKVLARANAKWVKASEIAEVMNDIEILYEAISEARKEAEGIPILKKLVASLKRVPLKKWITCLDEKGDGLTTDEIEKKLSEIYLAPRAALKRLERKRKEAEDRFSHCTTPSDRVEKEAEKQYYEAEEKEGNKRVKYMKKITQQILDKHPEIKKWIEDD